ncbi:MAG: cytochrome c biogenesis protein CcdA, partial [Alphaproteobacteria bacterium]|nr:cytochrome c biogenesis protein CcdA [Alphaproteobacteria bacterium]
LGDILPNALSPIIVLASLMVATAILLESALSFLGLGDPNLMTWGFLIGSFVGFALGLDADLFRSLSALIMLILALVIIAPAAPDGLKLQFGGFTHWIHERFAKLSWDGWQGQFITGLLLGALWSPCVGPILGAASLLASQRQDLAFVTASMLLFGLGASLPLLALGMMSHKASEKLRARLRLSGQSARVIFASLLVLISLLTLSGWDKKLETILVDLSPEWLTQLTTRF